MPRQGLSRAQVVDAAAKIADAEGLDSVTVARVASQLGIKATTPCTPRGRSAAACTASRASRRRAGLQSRRTGTRASGGWWRRWLQDWRLHLARPGHERGREAQRKAGPAVRLVRGAYAGPVR